MADPRPQLPTVSVVIPVRDDAVPLRRCLELIAQQTVPPWEVVVVDNGSRDDSVEVATAYGARVVPEPTPGIPAAAATGYDAARGEVIARCDADSTPPPDWIARIAEQFASEPALQAVTGWGWFHDLPRPAARVAFTAYLGMFYLGVYAALGHPPLWGSNLGIRRSTWLEVRDRVHRADQEVHDDIDLAFALGPSRLIRYDGALRVGVSARCLHGRWQLRRRLARALRTLRLNWAGQPPWQRWASRLSGPRRDDAGVHGRESGHPDGSLAPCDRRTA
jgi:glycosyltransferase involved in cell wall biosynthesis